MPLPAGGFIPPILLAYLRKLKIQEKTLKVVPSSRGDFFDEARRGEGSGLPPVRGDLHSRAPLTYIFTAIIRSAPRRKGEVQRVRGFSLSPSLDQTGLDRGSIALECRGLAGRSRLWYWHIYNARSLLNYSSRTWPYFDTFDKLRSVSE